MAKVNCCRDQQLAWSLWLGLQASCSHQTWRGNGQGICPGAAVVRFIVSCPWPARHTNDLPPSKCEMAKVNFCRDQQFPWSLWLGLQTSCSHQTWRGHGQSIGPGAAVVRFIVSCPWPARHTNDLPPIKFEMAKVNCCRPLRPAVDLVAVSRPAGKLQPPNCAWAWPDHRSRCCRCPLHRILSNVSCHTNDLPPSKCEIAKVNCCRPLRPAVGLVAVARPAGKLQPPYLAWAWPQHRPRCCRCPFHRILSWAGASHQ